MRRILIIIISLLLSAPAFAQNVSVGEATPGFEVNRFGGGTLSPEQYPGMILVLYFFGSY